MACSIFVRVYDNEGQPVSNCLVGFTDLTSGTTTIRATDCLGLAAMERVSDGSFWTVNLCYGQTWGDHVTYSPSRLWNITCGVGQSYERSWTLTNMSGYGSLAFIATESDSVTPVAVVRFSSSATYPDPTATIFCESQQFPTQTWYGKAVRMGLAPGSYTIYAHPQDSYTWDSDPKTCVVGAGAKSLYQWTATGTPLVYGVSGTITDDATFAAIAGAHIQITRDSDGVLVATNSTLADGTYNTGAILLPGAYTCHFSATNYTSETAPVVIVASDEVVDAALTWAGGVPYTIDGTITLSGVGPLAGVDVEIRQYIGGSLQNTWIATTDAVGYYAKSGLVGTCDYMVTPTLSGYYFSPAGVGESGVDGDRTYDFTAFSVGTHRIAGTILKTDLTGLSGVTVSTNTGQSSLSIAGGYYEISVPDNATYTVTPSLAGYTFTPASLQVVMGTADSPGNDFTAEQVPVIQILVDITEASSPTTPIPDVSVQCQNTGTGVFLTPLSTDENGQCTFTGLDPGTYRITPGKAGYTFTPTDQTVVCTTAGATIYFDGNGGTTGGHTVQGQVVIAGTTNGLAGVQVVADATHFGVTSADGTYLINDLPDGDYIITPSRPGWTFSPASTAITMAGANQSGVDFEASSSGTTYSVSGYCRTSGGAGIQGATVTIITAAGNTITGTTGSNGAYSIQGVDAGSTTITPSLSGYTWSPGSQTVNVSGDTTGINFTGSTTSDYYTISGTIELSGAGLGGVLVRAGAYSGTTDGNGDYQIYNVPNGTYSLYPSRAGYTFTPIAISVTINGANSAGNDFTAALAVPSAIVLPYIFHNVDGDVREAVDADKLMANLYALATYMTTIQDAQIYEYADIGSHKIASSWSPRNASLKADIEMIQDRIEAIEESQATADTYSPWNIILPKDVDLQITGSGSTNSGGYCSIIGGKRLIQQGHNFITSSTQLPSDTARLTAKSIYAIRSTVSDEGALEWNLEPLSGDCLGPNDTPSTEHLVLYMTTYSSTQEFTVDASSGCPLIGARGIILNGPLAGEEFYVHYYDDATNAVWLGDALTADPTAGGTVDVYIGFSLDDPDSRDPDGELGGKSTPTNGFIALVYCGDTGSAPIVHVQSNIGGFEEENIIELAWSARIDEDGSATWNFADAWKKPIRGIFGKCIIYDTAVGVAPAVSRLGPLPVQATPITAAVKGVSIAITPTSISLYAGSAANFLAIYDGSTPTPAASGCFKIWVEVGK